MVYILTGRLWVLYEEHSEGRKQGDPWEPLIQVRDDGGLNQDGRERQRGKTGTEKRWINFESRVQNICWWIRCKIYVEKGVINVSSLLELNKKMALERQGEANLQQKALGSFILDMQKPRCPLEGQVEILSRIWTNWSEVEGVVGLEIEILTC